MSRYHADSDADDEGESSVLQSPALPVEYDDVSPTSSGPMSTEHTPTTFTHSRDSRASPAGIITEWNEKQCADFISALGLERYAPTFKGTLPAMLAPLHANRARRGEHHGRESDTPAACRSQGHRPEQRRTPTHHPQGRLRDQGQAQCAHGP